MSDQLGIDDFAQVQEALWEARSKWHNIGTRLKLGVFDLDCINSEPGFGLDDKFNLMIKTRLKRMEPCTWRDLYHALNHPTVDMPSVGNKLTAKLPIVVALPAEQGAAGVAKTSSISGGVQDKEITETREKIDQLQKEYIDISVCAAEEFSNSVAVKKLRYSLLCLPSNLKKEHRKFVTKVKAEIKQAESAEDIIDVIGEHYDYLHYTLLKYVVDLYGSQDLKSKMANYAEKTNGFRKETRLEIFSEVCADEPEDINGRFTTMVSKHQMDWRTATLEDVEKFRIQVCRELSLYDFSLNLVKVARGCVEVTWRVPRSLVAYIQNSVKPSSQSMMEHHVATLTIEGFIVYDSSFAMQNEHKVIRLQFQAIDANISYLLEEMSPEAIVPHMLQRRLLTRDDAAKVFEEKSQLRKVLAVIDKMRKRAVGGLLTFCAALIGAEQPHVAQKILSKFQSLLKGEAVSHQQEEDEVMISGESSTQPSPPPPDSRLVTAQLEGSTLTRVQYNTIHSLTSSLLCIPTGDMVYDGHTLNPLTLHWHIESVGPVFTSSFACAEMALMGIQKIKAATSLRLEFLV
ncbi:hypothetical protein GBAR_LOCUS27340 [Geodia barretti]|uniref:CARD domain-containing protein n=1 Tax=Geodia barretti TaxID=519541 RepID=A0AA35TMI3_GEOBA|nr:hypothetical protein GBAR_LOCUS27340 [Geodia barretti]